MSKGFVVVAQNNNSVNYVRQAYALALSILMSQSEPVSISIITNDEVCEEYQKVFDQIIPIPWKDDAETSDWKIENRWKIYHVTPYDETIVLDTDMLVLEDISQWWKYCSNYDIKFCSNIINYKLEPVIDNVHRKAFRANKLSNPYFALHYFKKSELAYNFYKTLEFVSLNWEWCYSKFAPKEYQKWLSMDLATAISIEMLGIHQCAVDVAGSPLQFIHMKSAIQGWSEIPELWFEKIPVVLNSRRELIVGNIKQSKVFHYVNDSFLSDKIIAKLLELSNGKKEKN